MEIEVKSGLIKDSFSEIMVQKSYIHVWYFQWQAGCVYER